jgi:hypothetical protein
LIVLRPCERLDYSDINRDLREDLESTPIGGELFD